MSDLKDAATQELISALWDEFGPADVQPDEFTVADLSNQQGVSYDVARRVLDKAVQAGKLTKRKVGGRGWAYRYTARP